MNSKEGIGQTNPPLRIELFSTKLAKGFEPTFFQANCGFAWISRKESKIDKLSLNPIFDHQISPYQQKNKRHHADERFLSKKLSGRQDCY